MTRSALLLVLLAALGGCVISPQPSPPFASIDGTGIGLTEGIEATTNAIGFVAQPGTVDPPEGFVIVTNLDEGGSPSIAKVEPDGSFTIAIPGSNGQTFRFQAKNDSARSEPFDVFVQVTGSIAQDTGHRDCIKVDPGEWIDFDGAGDKHSVVIENTCGETVTFVPPRLRRGRAGFAFSPTAQITIPNGDTATLNVVAQVGDETEDVLILKSTGNLDDSRWITLTLPDP